MKHTQTTSIPRRAPRSALAIAAAAAALATLAACSSVPERNAALDLARSRYEAAQNQSQVATLAPEELKRASEALRVAEQAKASGDTIANVDHLAYLVSQRVMIAQDTASSRSAQAVTAGAAAERDRMRLAQRTQEADMAQRQLSASQQSNAIASQQLAASQQSNAMQSAALAKAGADAQGDKERQARTDAQVSDLQAQLKDINARKTERGMVVTLGDLLFSTGQSKLQGDGARTMAKLAEFLKRNPQRKAAIEGYTDSVGSGASNQALSDRRAHAVMDALVDLGVPGTRLSTEGFGEARPVASNDTATGRQMNRRVEVVFAPEAGDVMLK